MELNNDNFDEYIGHNNYVVVEFYTKWCKFCKLLAPEYDKLAEEYKNKRKDIIISRIEGQANDFTLQRFDIFRFPVIALFKPNKKQIYSIFLNQRNFDELNKWVNESCPIINKEEKKNADNNNNNENITINMTEIEKNQNLTTENEYIKNEFIDINKRIENIKNKLNLNNEGNINKNKKNKNMKFEFELSPIFILFSFIGLLIIFTIYSSIKNIFFINKEHIK